MQSVARSLGSTWGDRLPLRVREGSKEPSEEDSDIQGVRC